MGTTLRCATAPTMPHMVLSLSLLLFLRTFPARDALLRRTRERELARGRVLRNYGTGTDRRAVAHRERRHQRRVRTDEDVIADHRAMFVGTVVVTGNGARADVGVA